MRRKQRIFTVQLINLNTGEVEKSIEKESRYSAKQLKVLWQNTYSAHEYKVVTK